MPVAGADLVGVAERDGVGDGRALDEEADGSAEASALADTDGDAEVADAVGVVGAAVEGDPGVTSGTLSRTSSGAAPCRVGVNWEKSPLTNPATARTATTAPATDSSRVRRERRGRSPGTGTSGNRPGVPSSRVASASAAVTARIGTVGSPKGTGTVCPPSAAAVAPAPPWRSMYGRIRSGSKSSAAACSAERASRNASDVRWLQSQEGEPSGRLGVPHSGHRWPSGVSVTA
ncbi:hypothetical protein ABZ770_01020 [Streptomyces sp. NPDC006654]|uniref:hypothetical protein n=1 Tax=Streptomyces sp. NPDC006654 TaxID=3156897 RepID=UPI00340C687F